MQRMTRQRNAIREAIAHAARPLLPREVLDAARQRVPALGIATVYRNLKALVDEGALKVVNLPGENTRYETAGAAHHHHFLCVQCRRAFDVRAGCDNFSRLAPRGFVVEAHDVTLYGRCRDCAAPARSARRHPAARAGTHGPGS